MLLDDICDDIKGGGASRLTAEICPQIGQELDAVTPPTMTDLTSTGSQFILASFSYRRRK